MRSLLAQASTIEKAVEKAWSSAGMPTDFRIKILDFGQKSFFGLTKKPVIVSIFYEPKNQTSLSQQQQERPTKTKKSTPKQQQRPTKESQQQQRQQPRKETRQQQKPQRQQQQQRQEIRQKQQPQQQQRPMAQPKPQQEKEFWSDPLVHDITKWVKELTKKLNITTPFKAQVNKKALTIMFDGDVANSQDEERYLFSGLSYLLIQFLKKEHKKKFQGYQLIITSKRLKK